MKPTFSTIEKRVALLESARPQRMSNAERETAFSALKARAENAARARAALARINELLDLARHRRELARQSK